MRWQKLSESGRDVISHFMKPLIRVFRVELNQCDIVGALICGSETVYSPVQRNNTLHLPHELLAFPDFGVSQYN